MVASTRAPGGLKKVLGPVDLILMGIGAIVGTGIFVLTGTGALTAGPALTISFIVAAIACGFAAMCYAEFADRKSTRLNSSHRCISYAVFCLKKKRYSTAGGARSVRSARARATRALA